MSDYGWIPTADRLPEGSQYVNFVTESNEDVQVGKFWHAGYFQDIYGRRISEKVLRWKPIGLSSPVVETLVSKHEKLRQESNNTLRGRLDTIETAQLVEGLSVQMEEIRRKLGGTDDDS